MIREPGTRGGEVGKLPAQLPFLRLLLWEATQELEDLGRIREDKGHVCTQPQVWAGKRWPPVLGETPELVQLQYFAFSDPKLPARCQELPRCVGVGGW